MTLRDRHHGGIGEPEIEIGEAGVDLDGAPQQARREEVHRVLTADERSEERTRGLHADSRPQQLIDIDGDGLRHDELSPKLSDERCGELMRAVTPIGSGDERTRVRYDPHRAVTSSRR